ncbi:hypothetical protein NE236_26405 [Actinoallomurus purpureus]|uniref:hypothetical protein n=1 Tax=Actinoallomurus purpureus TaxID=478114 RepID=UPI002091EC66|nr:hypothetical protein [Actinoallomurus purpureus]MCO6008511.1 hypothetical protein [Actinoallomurus purpureus]
MKLMTAAAVAAASLLAFAPNAAAAGPASKGSVKAYQLTRVEPNVVEASESMYCSSDDTVTLEVSVNQTVTSPDDPHPTGHSKTTVPCSTRLEQRTVRVPMNGPVTVGRAAVVITKMSNSAGSVIYNDANMLPIWP